MPAVNYDLMRQEMRDTTAAQPTQIVYGRHPISWMNQTLTPTPDTLYFMSFFHTSDGPAIVKIPLPRGIA